MFIRKLELKNFRNYKNLLLEFDHDISVLFGENGQGKTNILEAIYICSCLRSHRTSKDRDLIRHNENYYKIGIDYFEERNEIENSSYAENIKIIYNDSANQNSEVNKKRRILAFNENKLDKNSEIMGLFNSVIFAPEDLNIIKEGPSARRRFLDLLISQIRKTYFSELGMFHKLLSQRNSLLKQMRDKKTEKDYEQMLIWDIPFASSCAKIIKDRMEFSGKINILASECHKKISYGKEEILVKYKTIPGIANDSKKEDIEQIILKKLKSMFYEDVEKGITYYGPHRDDIEIKINGEEIKSFASQGQQRTAVLSLKISELRIIKNETGKSPVLLLDDVMSELDKKRRKTLLESVGDAQIIITCTDRNQIESAIISEEGKRPLGFYEVKDGVVFSGL